MAELPAPHRLAKQLGFVVLFKIVDLIRAAERRVRYDWSQPGPRDG